MSRHYVVVIRSVQAGFGLLEAIYQRGNKLFYNNAKNYQQAFAYGSKVPFEEAMHIAQIIANRNRAAQFVSIELVSNTLERIPYGLFA